MITPLLLYLIKVNIAIAVFYLFYRLFLHRETFYVYNRVYFIAALALSALFPLVDFSAFFPTARPLIFIPTIEPFVDMELTGAAHGLLASDYIVIALLSGFAALLIRLVIQLISLFRLYIISAKTSFYNQNLVAVSDRVNPFSFFGWVFINLQLHDNDDVLEIIAHEKVHVKQCHTADILLYELVSAFCWYNPFMWMMRKAMKQNIEFLADRQTLKAGYNKQHYQYNLLKVSRIPIVSSIVNNFNFNDLRNRILMMNKKQSPNSNLLKFVFVIPVFIISAVLVNAKNISQNDYEPPEQIQANDNAVIVNENISKLPAGILDRAVIAFDKLVHDFGTIKEIDGETSAVFTFTNMGNKPLILNNVQASCGCTTPEWTKEPIPPGGMGFIRATYDPARRLAAFDKTLTVQSNGDPNSVTLHIKGIVVRR